jgi:hypothetical protein
MGLGMCTKEIKKLWTYFRIFKKQDYKINNKNLLLILRNQTQIKMALLKIKDKILLVNQKNYH